MEYNVALEYRFRIQSEYAQDTMYSILRKRHKENSPNTVRIQSEYNQNTVRIQAPDTYSTMGTGYIVQLYFKCIPSVYPEPDREYFEIRVEYVEYIGIQSTHTSRRNTWNTSWNTWNTCILQDTRGIHGIHVLREPPPNKEGNPPQTPAAAAAAANVIIASDLP